MLGVVPRVSASRCGVLAGDGVQQAPKWSSSNKRNSRQKRKRGKTKANKDGVTAQLEEVRKMADMGYTRGEIRAYARKKKRAT